MCIEFSLDPVCSVDRNGATRLLEFHTSYEIATLIVHLILLDATT